MNNINNTVKIVIALVVIAAIAVAAVMLSHKTTPNSTNSMSTSSSGQAVAATITYANDKFTPDTITIKAGDTVKIMNSSDEMLQFDSNPHPVHTDEPELNVGQVPAGQSKTFVVTKVGTWGYHDHLSPSEGGKIIVQ